MNAAVQDMFAYREFLGPSMPTTLHVSDNQSTKQQQNRHCSILCMYDEVWTIKS